MPQTEFNPSTHAGRRIDSSFPARWFIVLRRGAVFLLLLLLPLLAAAKLDRLATVDPYTPASKEDQQKEKMKTNRNIHSTKRVRVY